MKVRRHVYMFQPRFAPLVSFGTKKQTIRGERKRKVYPGDVLDLRKWLGKPYRSKQQRLLETTCVIADAITIDRNSISIGGVELINRDDFAQADGFADFVDMKQWFAATHGLPFTGFLTTW